VPLIDRLNVFHGEATPASARVYVRLDVDDATDLKLEGTISGPHCKYASTLPTTVAFQDLGCRPTPLAAAAIVDPCFWSPGMPMLYHVHVQICRQDHVLESAERLLGVRVWGVRGRSLYLDGRRWVLRGAECDDVVTTPIADWHEAAMAIIASEPSPELCRRASEVGVPLVPRLSHPGVPLIDRLRDTAQWPAAVLAIVEDPGFDAAKAAQVAPNLLLAQPARPDHLGDLHPWARLAICEVTDVDEFRRHSASCNVPVLAYRRLGNDHTPAAARTECDRLQRDLAPLQDLAGYIV
jgi:hypothetical protein